MSATAKFPRKFFSACCAAKTRTRSFSFALIAAALIVPHAVAAQVVISEIMYDHPGSESSGDHDWVEVFNAGPSPVDLGAYRFFEGGSNHTLNVSQGSATLPVGGYAIIANKADIFKVDQPSYAGMLFDSSFDLNSSGESIGIRAGDLSNVDGPFTYAPQDAATDNGSSLQRTSVASQVFIAAPPAPGTGSLATLSSGTNSGTSSTDTASTTQTTTTQTQTQTTSNTNTAPVSSYVAPPAPQIFADAGDDRTVIVGADTEFDALAYDRSKNILDHARFIWNFGDGATAEGPAVLHHFNYPGRYAVVLDIAEDRSASSDRIVVTAEPARLAFVALADGSVSIENRAGRELDLSNWIVRSFGRTFALPEHSLILAGEAMRIPDATLHFRSGPDTELEYPNGVVARKAGEEGSAPAEAGALQSTPVSTPLAETVPAPSAQKNIASARAPSTDVPQPATPEVDAAAHPAAIPDAPAVPLSDAKTTQAVSAAAAPGGSYLWWLGALGLALAGGGAAFAARRAGKGEWDIIGE